MTLSMVLNKSQLDQVYIVNWFKQYYIMFTTDQIGTALLKPLIDSG
jgi:hypothetical protein